MCQFKKKIENTCMTSLDKIKLVEKVAESHLKFETGYAAQLLSSFHGSFDRIVPLKIIFPFS